MNLGATEIILMVQLLIPLAILLWFVSMFKRLVSAVERLAKAAEGQSRADQ